MLESALIIWLLIGFITSLLTFSITLYKVNNITYTLEDLLANITVCFLGPLVGIFIILDKVIKKDLDDIVLFTHDRRD